MSRVAAFLAALAIALFAAAPVQPAFAGSGKPAQGHVFKASGKHKPKGLSGKRSELAGVPLPGKRLLADSRKGRNKGHHGPRRYNAPDLQGQAASSGVYLSSGRNNTWRGRHGHEFRQGKWKDHGRRQYYGGPQIIDARNITRVNNIAIAVVAGAVAAQERRGEARIEEACEAGAYCVVRLGPYSNSPKIITLNKTGAPIDPAAATK